MGAIEFSKKLEPKGEYDVIVCGGGVAGVSAALSAKERGKSTLLIEKSILLGGLATLGLINLFVPMCNGRGKQIIFGRCERWVRESARYGYDTIPTAWKAGEPKEPTEARYVSWFSPYIFAAQLTEEVAEAGIDLKFDCNAIEPVMDGKVCQGVVVLTKGGIEYYTCRMLIDTTGDLDVMRRAGVPHTPGKNFATYMGKEITLEGCKRAVETKNIYHAIKHVCGYNATLWGTNQPEGIPLWSGLTEEEVSDYVIRNQRKMLDGIKGDERLSRDVISLPLMPQFRTSCHLVGDYTFTEKDVYRHFDDSVCAINDFEHRDYLYEVPLRALCRSDYPNMITAGRSASAEGYGWDVIRVIPPAILTAQAAANAACLAIDSGCGVADVDIKALQKMLAEEDVMIHFPDEYVPSEARFKLHDGAVEIEGGHV